MAVEVALGMYRHNQFDVVQLLEATKEDEKASLDCPFRQNLLHDYESLWWITIWLLFSLFEPEQLSTRAYTLNCKQVFSSSAEKRFLFWHDKRDFISASKHLDSPTERVYLIKILQWAKVMHGLYKDSYKANRFGAQDLTTAQRAYELISTTLASAKSAFFITTQNSYSA